MHRIGLWNQSLVEYRLSLSPRVYRRPEIDLDSLYEIQNRMPSPATMGQEIEQFDDFLPNELVSYIRRRGGDYDGSGPLEWSYGPFVTPSQWLRWLYKDIRYPEWIWEWHNQHPTRTDARGLKRGCGSHVHFAVNPELPDYRMRAYEYWAILWNTLLDIGPYLAPLLAHTPKFRESAPYWAKYTYNRKGPKSMGSMIIYNASRSYRFITPNPSSSDKPFTVEVRAAESHPLFMATFERIMSYCLRNAFRAGWSPKLESVDGFSLSTDEGRRRYEYLINECILNLSYYRRNIYEALEEDVKDIRFTRMTIFDERRLNTKLRYENGLELFKTIIYWRLTTYPEKERNKDYYWRVLWFVYNEGEAKRESKETLWAAFKEEGRDFHWDTVPEYTGTIPKP